MEKYFVVTLIRNLTARNFYITTSQEDLSAILLISEERNSLNIYKKKNGKAVPLQARSGPEGSRKLRFPDFVTTA